MCLSLQYRLLGGYRDEERIKGKHPTLSSVCRQNSPQKLLSSAPPQIFSHLSFSLPFYSTIILVFAVASYREKVFLCKVQAQLYAVVQGRYIGNHSKSRFVETWCPRRKSWSEAKFILVHYEMQGLVANYGCGTGHLSLQLMGKVQEGRAVDLMVLVWALLQPQPQGKLRLIKLIFLKSCFISLH